MWRPSLSGLTMREVKLALKEEGERGLERGS